MVQTIAMAVNCSAGDFPVTRFFGTLDRGQMINPDDVNTQVEGNIIRTLKEELTFDRSTVTSRGWSS